MGERQYHLKFSGNAAASVDDYLEYRRIVGDDDGGVLFTPEQYEDYKRRVSPMRIENRLFISWTSPTGMDCKMIGPETQCFCQHRLKQHKTDFEVIPPARPIHLPCEVPGCRCKSYHYCPMNGSQPVRCSCKHFPEQHKDRAPFKCDQGTCKCAGFWSSWTCGCGQPAFSHELVVETKEERIARGHPVGRDTMYKGMGGVTGFSSLLDGYLRLDPSGRGAPSREFLEQPITAADHPFLRGHVTSIRGHNQAIGAPDSVIEADLAERMSAMKRPGEDDMDYYERRYQERLKAERLAKRGVKAGPSRTGPRIGQRKAISPSGATSGLVINTSGNAASNSSLSKSKTTKRSS